MHTYLMVAAWLTPILVVLRAEPVLAEIVGAGHSICGPCGCGPPLNSLLVWHEFMTLPLVPPGITAAKNRPDVAVDWAVTMVVIVGLTAAIFVSTNLVMWWNSANDTARGNVIQRAMFSLVAFPDETIVPLTLAAGMYWRMSRHHRQIRKAGNLSANHHLRSGAKQVEDFGDVAIDKLDKPL
jgi:hypothetical protein